MAVYCGHIVDPLNRRIYDGQLTVEDGRITDIREVEGVVADAPYIMPGFIDSHVHVESSMMMPSEFARLAMEHGSVGAICDPHEIANALGMVGVELMLKSAEVVNFHFLFGAPSCVPAVGGSIETSGAVLTSDDIAKLMQRDDIGFLAEMMNVPGLLGGDPEVLRKIQITKEAGKPIDGHAPGLMGEGRRRYAQAGISTDHECTALEEGRDAIAAGMIVQIREGSAAKDYSALSPLLKEAVGNVMLCTDDSHPVDLVKSHIDRIVRQALRDGYEWMDILTAASVVPVYHYHLPVGLLQVGDSADFIAVSDLTPDFVVLKTVVCGEETYSSTRQDNALKMIVESCKRQSMLLEEYDVSVMQATPLAVEDISDEDMSAKTIILAFDGKLITGREEGRITDEVQKIVVYNRYQKGAKPQVGYIKGFNMKCGALAQTIAHDCHNIVAVGTSDELIVKAINRVIELRGGVVATDGYSMCEMSLPVAGLISPLPGHEVAFRFSQLREMAVRTGCTLKAPFITMAFMALPVIPDLKLTDKGLFDARTFSFVQ